MTAFNFGLDFRSAMPICAPVRTAAAGWISMSSKTFDQKVNGGSYTYKSSAAGGPGQMEFPSMHTIPADCAAMLKISGTTYQEVVPFSCYPSQVKK